MRVRLIVIGASESRDRPDDRIPPVKVGCDGKPARIRRGPATVFGDAIRLDATGDAESPGRRGW
jgi:hypothetical protein